MGQRAEFEGIKAINKVYETPAGAVGILADSFTEAYRHPQEALRFYYGYYGVLRKALYPSQEEEMIIVEAEERMGKTGRNYIDFLKTLAGYEERVLEIVRHMGDRRDYSNTIGLNELGTRMRNAWIKKLQDPSWKPSDGDKFSDRVIWGPVNRTDETPPRIEWHVAAAHAMERVATAHLENDPKLAGLVGKKDWLFLGLTPIVTMNGLRGNGQGLEFFDDWRTPRPMGLGWLSERRVSAFKEVMGIK